MRSAAHEVRYIALTTTVLTVVECFNGKARIANVLDGHDSGHGESLLDDATGAETPAVRL